MIHPVLLAGGSGTRLWPLSRKSYPKQFIPLHGTDTLLQASARRLSGSNFAAPVIITSSDFRFIVAEQMQAASLPIGSLLVEPEGKNTAPAVVVAALKVAQSESDALLLIAPSDHAIPDSRALLDAIKAAAPAARDGKIITFGITPDRPETGYGYIEANLASAKDAPLDVIRFIEKPDPQRAEAMLAGGGYLWNAGIFLFSCKTILAAFESHAPDILSQAQKALSAGHSDLDFCRLDQTEWTKIENISIDHAIMEKSDALAVMPLDCRWSDLGDWAAVAREQDTDADGNALRGAASQIDCSDTLLWSGDAGPQVVGIGLNDAIVVSTGDAVLVADKSRAQDVKKAVTALENAAVPEATEFPWDHRPWGRFERLAQGSRFQVKRIVVAPGGILSLQSHHHRAEHWIVVEGTARVTIDEETSLLTENESVYVPVGAKHRLENTGKLPVVLIEVQTGGYLGEDDITRFEDVYARHCKNP